MTSRLTWGDEQEDQEVPIYPWDSTSTVLCRVAKKLSIPSYRYVRTDLDIIKELRDVHDWDDENTIHTNIHDIFNEWVNTPLPDDLESIAQSDDDKIAFLRCHQEELDEDMWNTRYREQLSGISLNELKDKMEKQEKEDHDMEYLCPQLTRSFHKLQGIGKKVNLKGWKIEYDEIRHDLHDERDLGQIFHHMKINSPCKMAVYHKQATMNWGEKRYQSFVKIPRQSGLWMQADLTKIQDVGIYIYYDSENPILIESVGIDKIRITIVATNTDKLLEEVRDMIGNHDDSTPHKIGVLGTFLIEDMHINIPIFQDACMNDPIISSVFMVDELRVKYVSDNSVGIKFTNVIKDCLDVKAPKLIDVMISNIHNQTGYHVKVSLRQPMTEKSKELFFLLVRGIFAWYKSVQESLREEYFRFLPKLKDQFEKLQQKITKTTRDKPEYMLKYPQMFPPNDWVLACQGKQQPSLGTEDDVKNLPPEQWIRFPTEAMEATCRRNFGIEPEYYICKQDENDNEYVYAGLKNMKDTEIGLAPCCFRLPQKTYNDAKIAKFLSGKKDEEVVPVRKAKSDHIIKKRAVIKNIGQLGTISYHEVERFLLCYNPHHKYYRVGIQQSASSCVDCLLYWWKKIKPADDLKDPNAIKCRKNMSTMQECLSVCLEENPGMSLEEIANEIANPDVYFNPKRFYRALEIYFNVRLVVFTETSEGNVTIMNQPYCSRTYYSEQVTTKFGSNYRLPIVVIIEHYGGRIDRTWRKHPHCELIVFRVHQKNKEDTLQYHFGQADTNDPLQQWIDLLSGSVSRFDGSNPIYPFHRKTSAQNSFMPYVVGQTTDPIGKVRWLHFNYYGQDFSAIVDPPMPVLSHIGLLPAPVQSAAPVIGKGILAFLNKEFDVWMKITLPDPSDSSLVFWTVRKSGVFNSDRRVGDLDLTFILRLPTRFNPSSSLEETLQTLGILQYGPKSFEFMTMSSKDNEPSFLIYEKVARVLTDLVMHIFSCFLVAEKIKMSAHSPDEIITIFMRKHIVLDPNYIYPSSIRDIDISNMKPFMRKNKVVLPSYSFWQRVQYKIKWILFYYPSMLFVSEEHCVKLRLSNFYTKVSDFSLTDPTHYYCFTESLQEQLVHASPEYPVVSCPISELPLDKPIFFWYHHEFSPYPYPSIVYCFVNLEKCMNTAKTWYHHGHVATDMVAVEDEELNDIPLYEWNPGVKRWMPIVLGEKPVFKATSNNHHFLFLTPDHLKH